MRLRASKNVCFQKLTVPVAMAVVSEGACDRVLSNTELCKDLVFSLHCLAVAGVAVAFGVLTAAEVGKATANFFSGLFGRNKPNAT